jgi:glycosyltransferase involved in cell wall biosynthesis
MFSGETIVCLSSIDWDANWQGHQEIMAALADAGNDVLFVENTGVRRPAFRDLPRLRRRVSNWRAGPRGLRTPRPRLTVYSPIVLPFPYSRIAQRVNCRLLARVCRPWARATGRARPIVWTFLPTRLSQDLAVAIGSKLTVYYCVDDLPSSSDAAARVRKSEAELLRTADLVFVTAEGLRARAMRLREDVHLFPFGVNYADFNRVRRGTEEPPAEIRALPQPLVGYLGGVNHKFDQQLLIEVARLLPAVHFALIGPVETDGSALAACPNVHLIGQRPHTDLPRILKGLSAGIIPYHLTEYTAHVYPAKLNEYLAMGLPVVSTPLPEALRFNDAHGPVISIAGDAVAFSAALRLAMDDWSPERVERRVAAARANRWEPRIAAMGDLVASALAGGRADRDRGSVI